MILFIDQDNQECLKGVDALIRCMAGGTFFSVDFTKKDGRPRHMTCRLGVTKHLKTDRTRSITPFNGNMTVFDTVAKGYRTVPLGRLHTVHVKGHVLSCIGVGV